MFSPFRPIVVAGLLGLFVAQDGSAAADEGKRVLSPAEAVAVVAVVDNLKGSAEARAYRVKPGDLLTLSVEGEPDLAVEAVIGEDGKFNLPGIEEPEQVAGFGIDDLRALIELKLRKNLPDAVVSLVLRQPGGRRIFAVGRISRKSLGSSGTGVQVAGAETPVLQQDTFGPTTESAVGGGLALNQLNSPFTSDLGSRVAPLAAAAEFAPLSTDRDGTIRLSAARSFQNVVAVRGTSFTTTNFLAPTAGTVKVSVTDIQWLRMLSQLSTSVTSGSSTLGRLNAAGTLTFSVAAGQRFAVAIFAAASGATAAARLGLYRLDVSFQPSAVVPVPAAGWLLLSGLAALAARRRSANIARKTAAA